MKLKILTVILILTLVANTSISVIGDTNENNTSFVNNPKAEEIRVAMLAEFPFFGWIELLPLYVAAVDTYQWTVGNTTFKFNVSKIYDQDILNGNLTTEKYDVLLVPGAGVGDGEAWTKGFYHLPGVKKWKDNVASFVKNGGGYVGYCGGAMLMAEVNGTPRTFMERQYQTSSLGVSCVKQDFGGVYSFIHKQAGPMAYANFYHEPIDFTTVEGCAKLRSGVPVDVTILKNHPVFDDFFENTQRIMWVCGPGFVIPENPDREVNVLAQYPLEEISDNQSTQIYQWKYTGGVRGILNGLLKGIKLCNKYNISFVNAFQYAFFLAGDWEPTDNRITITHSSQPCMTAEVYPNENKGRIFLCALHPEYSVWWGGHIENMLDTNENCLDEGLYTWVDIIPSNETMDDEISYNWWMIRRQVAWAAKVSDDNLPPIYGASQVSDICPYTQTSSFSIIGNTKVEAEGIIALALNYRHSTDNNTWSKWTLFKTDTNSSDGWSWDFNAPDGSGYYQFYSRRCVNYDGYTKVETSPPGPDAICYID